MAKRSASQRRASARAKLAEATPANEALRAAARDAEKADAAQRKLQRMLDDCIATGRIRRETPRLPPKVWAKRTVRAYPSTARLTFQLCGEQVVRHSDKGRAAQAWARTLGDGTWMVPEDEAKVVRLHKQRKRNTHTLTSTSSKAQRQATQQRFASQDFTATTALSHVNPKRTCAWVGSMKVELEG